MDSHDPYAPPESRVTSDSPANPKLLKQLLEAWPDDTKMLSRLRRFRLASITALVLASIYLALVLHERFAFDGFALAMAALGGFAMGLTMYLDSCLRQWPTLKKYFDWERMQQDHQNGNEH